MFCVDPRRLRLVDDQHAGETFCDLFRRCGQCPWTIEHETGIGRLERGIKALSRHDRFLRQAAMPSIALTPRRPCQCTLVG